MADLPARCAATTAHAAELPRLLVVGCGNPLAQDDSAGIELVRRLMERGESGCQLCALPFGGVDLLDMFPSADVILFVDAVMSGAPVGSLHLIPLVRDEVVPRTVGSLSSHGWNIAEALGLARALGRSVPRVMLLGIELGDVSPGAPRSPAVEHALSNVVGHFRSLQAKLVDADSTIWDAAQQFSPDTAVFPEGWHTLQILTVRCHPTFLPKVDLCRFPHREPYVPLAR